MPKLKTIPVRVLKTGVQCVINESDFDEKLHARVNEADNPPFTPETQFAVLESHNGPIDIPVQTRPPKVFAELDHAHQRIAELELELQDARTDLEDAAETNRQLHGEIGATEAAWQQAEQEMEAVARARWQNQLRYAMVDRLDELQDAYDTDGHDPIKVRATELRIERPDSWKDAIAAIVLQEQLIQLPEEEAETVEDVH